MGRKARWTSDDIGDQQGRVAIVTGSNSGIGYETAKALADKGANVILACRSQERGEAALERLKSDVPKAKAELILLDLASLEAVAGFVGELDGRHDRLDLLINNAGVMMPPKRAESADGFELQFGVNHLGHFALTGRLIDRLIKTPGSRVVNVSSLAHRWGAVDFDDLSWEKRPYKRMRSYGQSKLANLLFTFELQRRLESAGVKTASLASHPGWTRTNLQRDTPSFRFLNPLFAMRPWQGALPTLRAALDEGARGGDYYGPAGFKEMRGYPKPVGSSSAARDEGAALRLWEVSEELTGVRYDGLAAAA